MAISFKYHIFVKEINKTPNKMTTLTPIHQDTVLGKYQKHSEQVNHYNLKVFPYIAKLQPWERRETVDLYKWHIDELKRLEDIMKEDKELFDNVLLNYNLSVETFIEQNTF